MILQKTGLWKSSLRTDRKISELGPPQIKKAGSAPESYIHRNTRTTLKLKTAGSFKYVWTFDGQQELKG